MSSSDTIEKMLQTNETTKTNKPSITGCAMCDAEKRSSCRHKKDGGGEESGASNSTADSTTPATNESSLLEATLETINLQLTTHPTDSPVLVIKNTNQLTLKSGVSLKDIEHELNELVKTLSKELNLGEEFTLENSEKNLGISRKYDGKQLTMSFSDKNHYECFMQQLAEKNLINLPSESKKHTVQQEADKGNPTSGAPNPYTICLTPTPYK